MKRICTTILLLVLILSLSVAAAATEGGTFQTAGDLWHYWVTEDCVPDYITGIWSTDGSTENLTFGLLPGETGESAKQQILNLILEDSTAAFVTQTYSRNYLFAIMEDVNRYFERKLGFMSAGPSEYDNVVYIELHTDYQNNPDSRAAVAELEKKYGSAVSISFTDTIYHYTLETGTEPPVLIRPLVAPSPSPLPLLWMLFTAVLGALVLTEQRRRKLLTHVGTIPQTPLSIRQVKEQVLNSAPEVPSTLDLRVHAALDDLSH